MRFLFTLNPHPGQDIEKAEVTFSAPNWDGAAEFSEVLRKQLGIKGEVVITYAPELSDNNPVLGTAKGERLL